MISVSSNSVVEEKWVLEWARAETTRLVKGHFISESVATRSNANMRLSPDQKRSLRKAICDHRGPFFGHFTAHPTNWFEASCPVADIGRLHLCTHFETEHKVDGIVRNFPTVAALAKGDPSFGVKGKFELASIRGRPMLVSDSSSGPWCVLEGTNRLVAIHRLVEAGKCPFESVPIIVGVCPTAKEWHWWRPKDTLVRASIHPK